MQMQTHNALASAPASNTNTNHRCTPRGGGGGGGGGGYFMTGGKAHTLKPLIYGNKIADLSDVVESIKTTSIGRC